MWGGGQGRRGSGSSGWEVSKQHHHLVLSSICGGLPLKLRKQIFKTPPPGQKKNNVSFRSALHALHRGRTGNCMPPEFMWMVNLLAYYANAQTSRVPFLLFPFSFPLRAS